MLWTPSSQQMVTMTNSGAQSKRSSAAKKTDFINSKTRLGYTINSKGAHSFRIIMVHLQE
ncbi:hypothetical protein I7I53_00185 [Histoplasma capsulatum var. duboisii H88]|uniref:Uncharacterized protein n=1 Tax=Ajellomyces capsulatus (strain H88) TaxID=544711 RepID=A0A8A1LF75_AJEC8|nr:hypothetical protein I7I53_00185 [Histoplasma capsulatum var. duboisii H88]